MSIPNKVIRRVSQASLVTSTDSRTINQKVTSGQGGLHKIERVPTAELELHVVTVLGEADDDETDAEFSSTSTAPAVTTPSPAPKAHHLRERKKKALEKLPPPKSESFEKTFNRELGKTKVTWHRTSGLEPLVNADDSIKGLKEGDIQLHYHPNGVQAWVLVTTPKVQWKVATPGEFTHPNHSKYCLWIKDDFSPSWILGKSKKKYRSEAKRRPD